MAWQGGHAFKRGIPIRPNDTEYQGQESERSGGTFIPAMVGPLEGPLPLPTLENLRSM